MQCQVCSEPLKEDAKACHVCGTSVVHVDHMDTSDLGFDAIQDRNSVDNICELPDASSNAGNGVFCPSCGATYDATYSDQFCVCGTEIEAGKPCNEKRVSQDASSSERNKEPIEKGSSLTTTKPVSGTFYLTLFSEEKLPVAYFPITSDVTLIGRSDPIRGDFPDVDLSEHLDDSIAKRVSRKHILILRSRDTGQFVARPLSRNTGTQIDKSLAEDLAEVPISVGTKLVLGGVVRLKFEQS